MNRQTWIYLGAPLLGVPGIALTLNGAWWLGVPLIVGGTALLIWSRRVAERGVEPPPE